MCHIWFLITYIILIIYINVVRGSIMCQSCMFGDDSRTFYCSLHTLSSTIPPRETDGTQQWFRKTHSDHSATKQFCQFSNLPLALLLCWFEQNTCLMERTACQYPYLCYILLVPGSSWFLKGCNCRGWSGKSWHICSRLIWLSHYCKVVMTWGLATHSVNGKDTEE